MNINILLTEIIEKYKIYWKKIFWGYIFMVHWLWGVSIMSLAILILL